MSMIHAAAVSLACVLSAVLGYMLLRYRRNYGTWGARQHYRIGRVLPPHRPIPPSASPRFWAAVVAAAAIACLALAAYLGARSAELLVFPDRRAPTAETLQHWWLQVETAGPKTGIPVLFMALVFVVSGAYVLATRTETARLNRWLLNTDVPVDAEYPKAGDPAAEPPTRRWVLGITLGGTVVLLVGLVMLVVAVRALL